MCGKGGSGDSGKGSWRGGGKDEGNGIVGKGEKGTTSKGYGESSRMMVAFGVER